MWDNILTDKIESLTDLGAPGNSWASSLSPFFFLRNGEKVTTKEKESLPGQSGSICSLISSVLIPCHPEMCACRQKQWHRLLALCSQVCPSISLPCSGDVSSPVMQWHGCGRWFQLGLPRPSDRLLLGSQLQFGATALSSSNTQHMLSAAQQPPWDHHWLMHGVPEQEIVSRLLSHILDYGPASKSIAQSSQADEFHVWSALCCLLFVGRLQVQETLELPRVCKCFPLWVSCGFYKNCY